MLSSKEIRQSFIDFFVERDHRHVASAPLVPHGDATLLFTNAGMVQFKNNFLGLETPEHPRAVTSQKCLRVSGKHNDLENVGPSPRHHTFFEMLGNFSFGDYFKAEAIEFAWELVTRVWGLDPSILFATVFHEDDEAFDLWLKISSLPEARVLRCGAKDNFWAMGDTGPCGPCSEIFVDLHPELPAVDWDEGSENGRYLEIWNLVFMQYARAEDGTSEPLPNPSIDTGAGLERVTAVLQGAHSNYDTDLFRPLLESAADAAGRAYGVDPQDDVSMRVIADHIRSISFLLADGVIPGNEGRGYVLRRLLRRAVRHGMRLGFEEPFLGGLVPVLDGILGQAYPELGKTADASRATIRAEEEKFLSTLASGARQVQDAVERARSKSRNVLDGETVFRLYDTYGLPIETVREIAEEEQFSIDEAGFESALEDQRRRSRSATSGVQAQMAGARGALLDDASTETEFLGYERLEASAEVRRVARLQESGLEAADCLEEGQTGVVVLDRTVFYAESGGQVGDRGEMQWSDGRARVLDTQKDAGVFLHTVEVIEGSLRKGQRVELQVDEELRRRIERHHTATHLLHAALRHHLGEGVRQAGSLVHPDRLRFDFTHGAPLSEEEKESVETTVAEWIRRADDLEIIERDYEEALAEGAMALFGEKYGDRVRTVKVPDVSLELCGGCHVRNSGAIGTFTLVSERGIASGVRRIEALAGSLAEEWHRAHDRELRRAEAELGVPPDRVAEEIAHLKEKVKQQDKELAQLRMKLLSREGPETSAEAAEVAGIKVVVREVPSAPGNELRNLTDVLRSRLGSGVVVVGAREEGKVSLLVAVTPDLTDRLDAGRLVKTLAAHVGGGGGGRRDFAQAGGKRPEGLPQALEAAPEAVESQLQEQPVEN